MKLCKEKPESNVNWLNLFSRISRYIHPVNCFGDFCFDFFLQVRLS